MPDNPEHEGETMAAKFEISKGHAGKFRFHLKAPNGEIIAASQGYETKANAEKGIEAIKTHAPNAKVKTTAKSTSCMTRSRLAATTWLITILLMTTGCGIVDRAVNGVTSNDKPPPVGTPDSTLAKNPMVAKAEPSVVKVRSIAPQCQKVLEGTGFAISPDRVMTNAHVVSGASDVAVEVSGNPYDATVVSYDPAVDIAILAVPHLPPGPLPFANAPATPGTDAIVMGYPGGGAFVATPARIRELIQLNGPDIYRSATVNREVYTVRASVEQGNTGGPLIDLNGQVLGVVFGSATDGSDTGFVLTAREVARQLAHIGDTAPVSTGPCVPG
jgi:S1-C subfamily serine protease